MTYTVVLIDHVLRPRFPTELVHIADRLYTVPVQRRDPRVGGGSVPSLGRHGWGSFRVMSDREHPGWVGRSILELAKVHCMF